MQENREKTTGKKANRLPCAVLVAWMLIAITGCTDETSQPEQAKAQSATVSLFGGTHSATVKGTMTDSEWAGVADTIADKLNFSFNKGNDNTKNIYREIFARGITYIVEPNPNGYNNLKTIGDGKTVYIALSQVNSDYVVDGAASIYANGIYVSKGEMKERPRTISNSSLLISHLQRKHR
jgi:hypothetical protein